MPDREKLIELVHDGEQQCSKILCRNCEHFAKLAKCKANMIADRLISEGVTVRERGRWVLVDDGVLIGQGKHHECSRCGTWTMPWRMSNYCPYCGADMRGEEDG